MPEGDTIYKVARFMAPLLHGQELAAVRLLGAQVPLLARRNVLNVTSWGKHLLIALTPEGPGGYILRVHLGMHGTWHSYPVGAAMRRPIGNYDVALLRQDGHRFVCYGPEDAEVLLQADVPGSSVLGRLGPCLLAEPFDDTALRARIERIPITVPLIDVLLGQHIAAGLGNVYKSELLFLHGLHPLTPKGALSMAFLIRLFADGRTLLKRNLGGWPRTITFDHARAHSIDPSVSRYFVYGRAHAPCLSCGTAVVRRLWGRHNRSCYFCPKCQRDKPLQLNGALMPKLEKLP